MTVARTVADVLTEHTAFDVECIHQEFNESLAEALLAEPGAEPESEAETWRE